MNYKIIPETADGSRVVLKRTKKLQYFLVALFILFGAPMAFFGAIMFMAGTGLYSSFFFTGFGVLFLAGAYLLVARVSMPESFVFDNDRGVLRVREGKREGGGEASIPYSEIAGITDRVAPGSKGRRYSVVIAKRDGALWTVYSASTIAGASAFREELVKNVRLEGTFTSEVPRREPARFIVERGDLSTSISWRDGHPVRRSLVFFVVIGSMGMVLFGTWPSITNIVVYALAVIFMLVIAVLMLYGAAYSIGKTKRVTVSGVELRYEESGGPVPGKHFSVPIGDIASVLFNFSLSQGESVIYIVRKNEKQFYDAFVGQNFSPGDIMTAVKAMMKMKRINAIDLSTVEKIDLELLVQDAVARHGGIRGL